MEKRQTVLWISLTFNRNMQYECSTNNSPLGLSVEETLFAKQWLWTCMCSQN